MSKSKKRVIKTIIFFIIASCFLLIIVFSSHLVFKPEYLKYEGHVNYGNNTYVLYEHPSSFQELPYLLILRFSIKDFSSDLRLKTDKTNNTGGGKIILTLYAGKGFRFNENKIGIKGKYLTLASNGLYYSLYDIGQEKVLIHKKYPYGDWILSDEFEKIEDKNDIFLRKEFHEWSDINISTPILDTLNNPSI